MLGYLAESAAGLALKAGAWNGYIVRRPTPMLFYRPP